MAMQKAKLRQKNTGKANGFHKSYSCSCLEMDEENVKLDFIQNDDQQIATIKEFRKVVQDLLEPHHDDQFLYRWLKARDFDISKAEKMIRESMKFRKKFGFDTILTTYEIPQVFRNHSITVSLGFDYDNNPVRYIAVGICDFKGFVQSLKIVDILKILIYLLESDLKRLRERKKKRGIKIEEKSTYILDLEDFSLKQFYDKAVINATIQLLTMYQDNYPETLKTAYVINVPSYFNWVFNIFKPFLNSVTLKKVQIYKTNEWQEKLRAAMDPKNIPAFLGGKLTDPDGNPECLTLINRVCKIEPFYYLSNSQHCVGEEDFSMKSVIIQQRSSHQVPVTVEKAGSLLKWLFMTKEYNIRFGLFYKRDEYSKRQEIIPIDGVNCQAIPEENEYICDKTGIYILHFDNTYSWMTAKQLHYKVEVENSGTAESNNN